MWHFRGYYIAYMWYMQMHLKAAPISNNEYCLSKKQERYKREDMNYYSKSPIRV